MKSFLNKIAVAFSEPSTWAGIGGPLGVLGTQIQAPYSTACYVAAAVCAMLATIMREGNGRGGDDGHNG